MEPMALGSPSSPSSASSSFLPAYLMGVQPMTPPRHNLSPTKVGGRSLAFGQSPNSPKDSMNRSATFLNRNPLSPAAAGSSLFHGGQGSSQNLNASVSGPPTQGLFDSLSTERNLLQGVSSPRIDNSAAHLHPQPSHRQIMSPFSPAGQQTLNQTPLNDSLYNNRTPRRPSIIPGPKHNFTSSPYPAGNAVQSTAPINPNSAADCWITVFGFPQSATGMMLTHFSQCGTIVNKVHPQNSGNWMHLKFTSRLECDRAMNYHEKVLNNFFMIGVTRCKDPLVLEQEKQREDLENSSYLGNTSISGGGGAGNTSIIRPLAHVAYKTVQSPTDVLPSPTAPTKSTGILDRAMDFFLGW